MGWMTGVQSPPGAMKELFHFVTTSRLLLGPSQPPMQWVLGAHSLEVNWAGCEADNSPPYSAKVKDI